MRWLCLCLAIAISGFAVNPRPIEEKSSYIKIQEAIVNASTGNVVLCIEDLALGSEGALSIGRVYDSKEGNWLFFPHVVIEVAHLYEKERQAKIGLSFCDADGKRYKAEKIGVGELVFDANEENFWEVIKVTKYEVELRSDKGEKRAYQKKYHTKFNLVYQQLPSGQEYRYEYDRANRLLCIQSVGEEIEALLSCHFNHLVYQGLEVGLEIKMSDGRSILYSFETLNEKGLFLLDRVIKEGEEEQLFYQTVGGNLKLSQRKIGSSIVMKSLFESNGKLFQLSVKEGDFLVLHQFYYGEKESRWLLPTGEEQRFAFSNIQSKERCIQRTFFEEKEAIAVLDLTWDEIGLLRQATLFDIKRNGPMWTRKYSYGEHRELTCVSFSGDLTGENKEDTYETSYEYDALGALVNICFPHKRVNVSKINFNSSFFIEEASEKGARFSQPMIPNDLGFFFPDRGSQARYTARGQVCENKIAQGAHHCSLYNLDGSLRVDQIKGIVKKTYDWDQEGYLLREEIFDEKKKIKVQQTSYRYYENALVELVQTTQIFSPKSEEETIRIELVYDEKGRKKGNRISREEERYLREEEVLPNAFLFFKKDPEPLQEIKNPSFVRLYDPLGRLKECYDEGKEIHYTFDYDVWGRVIRYTDEKNKKEGFRQYDSFGNLIYEKLLNGVELVSHYNLQGKRNFLKFQDGSFIRYLFENNNLKEIKRFDKTSSLLYRHYILRRDDNNFPVEQLSAEGVGAMKFAFDPSGSISAVDWRSFHSEKTEAEILQQIENPSSVFEHKFDSIGRLVGIQSESLLLFFNYDPWHRRMTKRLAVGKKNSFKQSQYLAFIYDADLDIGAIDFETKEIKQLRIMAEEKLNPGGGVIAYELEKKLYIPLFDVTGNLKELYDCVKNEIAETYQYTKEKASIAYNRWGQKLPFSSLGNPWRSAGERCAIRLDEETGYFEDKGRYFDSYRGKWRFE